MMIKFILFILLFFTNILYATVIVVDDSTEELEILSSSKIYIDKTRKLTIDNITSKDIQFKDNDKELLSYGYSPDFDVWVKFTVRNDSDKAIHKILEYGNSMTTDVVFYDVESSIKVKDGLLNLNPKRGSINPVFKLVLQSQQTKTFYIKVSSYITTMIIKMNIWEYDKFYKKELKHQSILQLFFGAMLVLAIYNLFVYFFTRDTSYLFYVLYIVGVVIHHLMYVGIAPLYLLNQNTVFSIVGYATLLSIFPIISLAFFTKFFLNIKQYMVLNKILNFIIVLTILLTIIFLSTDEFNKFRNLVPILLFGYLVFLTFYSAFKKNRQSYFILTGWLLIFIAIVLMYFSSVGVFNIYEYFAYTVETAFVLEAIIFAIALSDKINTLKTNLIVQKRTENERLEIQVQEKTKDLKLSLEEKTLLLQELNHRVKNNMQMIVSLIRLQTNDIDDKKVQALFLTTQNRLNAMSQLHELLYQKEDISYINAYEYFTTLIEGLQDTYTQDISINYTIDTDLQTEQAISCGIVLNELVTNSLKYAFKDDTQKDKYIDIFLTKFEDKYTLIVKDNGVGYDQEKTKKSFGLILVTTLVESKLEGSITIDTHYGVETTIIWREEDEED